VRAHLEELARLDAAGAAFHSHGWHRLALLNALDPDDLEASSFRLDRALLAATDALKEKS
jgi:hypothetical protein